VKDGNDMKRKVVSLLIFFSFLEVVFANNSNINMPPVFNTSLYIRQDGKPFSYIGTLNIKNNRIDLSYEYESMGFTNSIMAYKIIDNDVVVIIKSRWTGDEQLENECEKLYTKYYKVDIHYGNPAKYNCNQIDDLVKENISNYIFSETTMSNNPTYILQKSNSNAKIIGKIANNGKVKIISVNGPYERSNTTSDYWYYVLVNDVYGYIHGNNIDFVNAIIIMKKE
jgi:hypothetical protein